MIRYIPNLLTIFRIILVPVFLWLIFYIPHPKGSIWALVVFVIASISDYFDGMIARKYQVISNFGKIMDPLADKILVIAALIAIALPPIQYVSWIVVSIIVIREVAVTILREQYAKKGIIVAANMWGKWKTVFQMTGVIASILLYSLIYIYKPLQIHSQKVAFIMQIYFWGVALITILSGMNYFITDQRKKG